jgi:hypothetical protein
MPALCFSNHHGPYVVQLLFGLCIFLTFLSHIESDAVVKKMGGSPINVNYSESLRVGQVCSGRDISVSERMIYTGKDGIPVYGVEISNTCATGCAISNIHISCGSFASTIEIDPKTFRRIAYNDCLVKDGGKLASGESVSFNYANNAIYPLKVASVQCDA